MAKDRQLPLPLEAPAVPAVRPRHAPGQAGTHDKGIWASVVLDSEVGALLSEDEVAYRVQINDESELGLSWDEPEGGFPPGAFLQLLFGRHSLDELRASFPDVWINDTVTPLLRALFPPRPSWVLRLD